ncbi:unnamed protein product [Scytosiphon promiscuus]
MGMATAVEVSVMQEGEEDDQGENFRDDCSSVTETTSALPAGDTDIEDEREIAVSGHEEGDGAATTAEDADGKQAGGDGGGVEDPEREEEEEVEAANKDDRESSSPQEMRQRPISQNTPPQNEAESRVDAYLDTEDVEVIEPPVRITAGGRNRSGGRDGSDPSGGSAQGGGSAGGSSGGSGAGKGQEPQECFVCNRLVPSGELEIHVNMCLDKQLLEIEAKEKREERTKRKNRSVVSRYDPAPIKTEAGESSKSRIASRASAGSGTRARSGGSAAKSHRKSSPAVTASVAATAVSAPATGAASAGAANGKRKGRGDDRTAGGGGGDVAAARESEGGAGARRRVVTGKGKGKQRERQDKKTDGKGKGKLMPPDAARQGFECPKKLKGYRAGGCGEVNEESSQKCRKCNLRLWAWVPLSGRGEGDGAEGGGGGAESAAEGKASVRRAKRVRLGDPVKWPETPHLGRPGEMKIQVGFVHSLDDEESDEGSGRKPHAAAAASTGAASGAAGGAADADGIVTACCSYKNFRGYLSAATRLENLQLLCVPPPPTTTTTTTTTPAPTSAPPAGDGGGRAGGGVSSVSEEESVGSLTGPRLGASKCEHVEAGTEVNYKSGKCFACHKEQKRVEELSGCGGDPTDAAEEEQEEAIVEDDTVQCETPGCGRGQYQLGVCSVCFARHRKRIAAIQTAARKTRELQEKNPPPCRACEGLLSVSKHAACLPRVDTGKEENEPTLVQSLDKSTTGRCSECKTIGGKGVDDQLLLCDGMDCPNATHMRCLPTKLYEVPRWLWYCTECCRDGNDVKSARGCQACGSTDNDDKILLCDGPGCNNSPYHYDCLPVPLEGVPTDTSEWFCPRCAHSKSAPAPAAPSSACGGGGSGDGSGGSGGSGGDGRSNGARATAQGSSSSTTAVRGGGGTAGKRKRASSNSGGAGSNGSKNAVTAAKRAGSSTSCPDSKTGGLSPLPDLCAHPQCLLGCGSRPPATTTVDKSNNTVNGSSDGVGGSTSGGVTVVPPLATTTSADAGGGGGDAAAGRGLVEVLAQKEAESRRCRALAREEADRGRWRCKSDKCREINNSYHRMCLEARSVEPAEAGEETEAAPKHEGGEEALRKSVDLVCPACCSIVATGQQVVLAQQGILRYRTFKAALASSFYAEFGKPRSEVEKDRGLGFKGSVMIKGKCAYMYGSICEGAVDFIFRTVGLTSEDCFLDIGSGLGQIVMQAAAWAGCRSLGVEVVKERHDAAERLLKRVVHEAAGTVADTVGKAELTWGDFVHKWDMLKDCTVIYLNNENRWFKARNDPDKAKYSYESTLVRLLQEQERSVTLVTMEQIHPRPQGWTHEEHVYGTPNGEKRVATFASGSLKIHFYKTNSGSWQCSFCDERHAKTVSECSCPSNRRTDLRPRKGSGSSL